MFTVSLIGPDGVGKTTVAKRIENSFPFPMKYLYMGLNVQAANFMLPTTRLWNMFLKGKLKKRKITYPTVNLTNQSPKEPRKIGFYRQIIKFMRKTGGLGNRILEEWYRQFIAYYYEKRGYIVIFDRHFIYDFYEDRPTPKT